VLVALGCALAVLSTPLAPGAASTPEPARGAVTRAATTEYTNPLAGRPWGVYKGNADQAWPPYAASTGTRRQLLARIALRPKAKWFGRWISNDTITTKVRQYVANASGGDPEALVQMTIFRMVPWEHDACRRLPTEAERASYRQWIRRAAAGIGDAHVALVLQPDGPFALCAPGGSQLPSRLIAYAAKVFSELAHTSVYIDAGASDWPKDHPEESARFLMPAGITYARGFALNSTHYASTADQIAFGTRLVAELAERGAPDKHFVINTSSNGRPFDFGQARGSHPDNAKACDTRTEVRCVTLGIPPTDDVADPRWGLSTSNRTLARAHVDGYLWFGRPWLYMQADPFVMSRALKLARTTPY
jgi:hypothetical protein